MKRKARHSLCLLVSLLFGLTVAVRAEEPQKDKTAAPVEVRMSEYTFTMPKALPAGPTTFLLRNEGKKNHRFKIEGPGIEGELMSPSIKPEETGTLAVTLQPGEYKIYCPLGSHAIKGMTMTLTVTPKP